MTSYPLPTSPTSRRDDVATTTRGQPNRLRSAYITWREVRRINRQYRRRRREFERALDTAHLSPNAQHELYTLWTISN